ncbi:MAG: VOC family protein [Pseudomonadota bacterium]
MTATATGNAPIFMVRDIEENIRFWEEKAGFSASRFGEPTGFAIMSRDKAHIMLAIATNKSPQIPNWQVSDKISNAFIWVDDAKAMYKEFIERGAPIDWELYEAPWGGLEFGIQDPDGRDIAIGQVL